MGRGPSLVSQAPSSGLMLLLDSKAISAVAHGPAGRRDRVRALIAEMRRRELPIGTVAAGQLPRCAGTSSAQQPTVASVGP